VKILSTIILDYKGLAGKRKLLCRLNFSRFSGDLFVDTC
jgi:hypothetical protein